MSSPYQFPHFDAEKGPEAANSDIPEFSVSIFGIIFNNLLLSAFTILLVKVWEAEAEGGFLREWSVILRGLLIVYCCCGILLCYCSFFKTFLTSPKLRFIRNVLASLLGCSMAGWSCLFFWLINRSSEVVILAATFAFILCYAPFYYYVNTEDTCFRPIMRINRVDARMALQ